MAYCELSHVFRTSRTLSLPLQSTANLRDQAEFNCMYWRLYWKRPPAGDDRIATGPRAQAGPFPVQPSIFSRFTRFCAPGVLESTRAAWQLSPGASGSYGQWRRLTYCGILHASG